MFTVLNIIKVVLIPLLIPLLKYISGVQLFRTFGRLSLEEKKLIFTILKKDASDFEGDFSTRSIMQIFGIRYSPQFMKNLFYYIFKKDIHINDKGLSAFLSLPGLFSCGDDGRVEIRQGAIFLSYFLFFFSLCMVCATVILIRNFFL